MFKDKSLHKLVGWLCCTSHRQRGHLETAPPFTVPWEGREARFLHYRFLHRSYRESNPGPSHGSPIWRLRRISKSEENFVKRC